MLLASAPGAPLRREVMLRWSGAGLNLLTLPTADELLAPGSPALPRQVRLEDLLGRTPVQLDAQGLSAHVSVTDETDYAASFVVVEKKEP